MVIIMVIDTVITDEAITEVMMTTEDVKEIAVVGTEVTSI